MVDVDVDSDLVSSDFESSVDESVEVENSPFELDAEEALIAFFLNPKGNSLNALITA